MSLRIADSERGPRVRFRFDGHEVEAYEGESVAAALWAAGIRSLASDDQHGPPARTLFCAMGVCQQCAVWIEGRSVEGCRVSVREGIDARSSPDMRSPVSHAPSKTVDSTARDVLVLGAGPAGVAAAVEAHAQGLRVGVIDENPAPGGQVYRIAPGIASRRVESERIHGDAMRAALDSIDAARHFDARVWHVEHVEGHWSVHLVDRGHARTLRARALIVATGAQERHLPFEGWTRAGVMGLAAATVMLKVQRMLPGRDVIVAGAGPLLLFVAKTIVESGGRVAAVIDAQPLSAWFAQAFALASRLDLALRGVDWIRTLRRHRVPWHASHIVQSVGGESPSLNATVVPVDRDGKVRTDRPSITVGGDVLCCGYGLMPATDVSRLVRASHRFDATRGGWQVVVDDDQRCDRPFLYAAGDGAGVVGAACAPWQGRIAALRAALDLGCIPERTYASASAAMKQKRDAAERFGAAMTRVANVGDGAIAAIAPATIVCQCERITRASLDAAIDDGAITLNDLRTATRCGMGPCGGRLCEDAAARLITVRTGRARAEVGQVTGRPPLRPVDLDVLAGAFDYDTLPIAAPSPL
ncbi:MAG TPA: 2Fe-2S iron-sulfur cluster-binding protein [Casimicrobiaceae bacterium]|nr:2Fe-2S iron-sulfur cluster-binding protein [Casimicrobiaceae bacterium]